MPILFAYIFCITFASMLKTSWTDPGVKKIDYMSILLFANLFMRRLFHAIWILKNGMHKRKPTIVDLDIGIRPCLIVVAFHCPEK